MKSRLAILSVCSIVVLFSACVTQSKVEDWNRKHPDQSAAYCADHFPCRPKDSTVTERTDSTAFNQSLDELSQSVDALNAINDSLLDQLQRKDTACAKYIPIIQKLQAMIKAIRDSARSIPPKIITIDKTREIVDNAAVKAAEAKAASRDRDNAVLQDHLNSAQAKLKGWKTFGIGCIVGLALLILILILVKRFKK